MPIYEAFKTLNELISHIISQNIFRITTGALLLTGIWYKFKSKENKMDDKLRDQILAIHRRSDLSDKEKQALTNEIYATSSTKLAASEKNKKDETSEKDCKHYKRGCDIQCVKCLKWCQCRLCHDEQIHDHLIDRFATIRCRCRLCKTEQNIVKTCENCEESFGDNFCPNCRMWCDFEIFHCEDCGICRKGTRDKFEHCKNCDACLPAGHQNECKAATAGSSTISRDVVCPICLEELFSSTRSWQPSPCGHRVHSHCITEAIKKNEFRCPLCKKCLFEVDWEQVQREIELQPMPEEYKDMKRTVYCNDCETTTKDAPFHVLGVRCSSCKSFNTQ